MKNTSTFSRIISCILVLTLMISMAVSHQIVYAKNGNNTKINYEDFTYSQERALFEAFVQKINTMQNKDLSIDMAETYVIEEDIATIIFANDDGGITAYQTALSAESDLVEGMESFPAGATEINESNVNRIPEAVKTAISIIKKIWDGIQFVCKTVRRISGEDVCAIIGQAMLASLKTEVQYKATAVFYKDPSCVPPHSQQCNMAPYAYWETTFVVA